MYSSRAGSMEVSPLGDDDSKIFVYWKDETDIAEIAVPREDDSPRADDSPREDDGPREDDSLIPSAGQTKIEPGSESDNSIAHGDNQRHASRGMVKSWWLEILAIFLAVGLLIAIYVILAAFDKKRTSTWPLSINLSASIAVLSTLSRTALVMVASEVIAQDKWSWFHRARPLYDMETFDQASRGFWGGLGLFGKSSKRPHLLLAIVVVLASLAMGPFAQQAALIVGCDYSVPGARAIIPNLHTVGKIRPGANQGNFDVNATLEDKSTSLPPGLRNETALSESATHNNIISSLLDPKSDDSRIRATCPSGNCTFPLLQDPDSGLNFTHRSPGFCSICIDLSKSIQYSSGPSGYRDVYNRSRFWLQNWTLPNSHNIGIEYDSFTKIYDPNDPEDWRPAWEMPFLNITARDWSELIPESAKNRTFSEMIRFSFLNTVFISLDGLKADDRFWDYSTGFPPWPDFRPSATGCTLYPCLKTYFANITMGEFNETVVSSKLLRPYSTFDGQHAAPRNDSRPILKARIPVDLLSAPTPCLVDGKVYSSDNISTAPGAVTLQRLTGLHDNITEVGINGFNESHFFNITAPPECIYGMDIAIDRDWTNWYPRMRNIMRIFAPGRCGVNNRVDIGTVCKREYDERNATSTRDKLYQAPNEMTPFWLEGIARLPRRSHTELSEYMDAFADSLTRKLRMGAFGIKITHNGSAQNSRMETPAEHVIGEVWQTTTCFSVDWRWMMLSTSLTFFAAVVLAWTILRGIIRGEEAWKSSILPLIYHQDRFAVVSDDATVNGEALENPQASGQGLMTLKDMEADSRRVRIVFKP